MNRFRKSLSVLALAAMACAAAVSCSDKGDTPGTGTTPPPSDSFYNFATYNGSGDGSSSFTVIREGDAGEATVTFSRTFKPEQLAVGDRVFMAYTTLSGKEYVSGPGTLFAVSNVTGGKPVPATELNGVRQSTPVKLVLMKRTGNYLNVAFQVPSLGSLSRLQLTQRENPKNPEFPLLGLFVRTDSEMGNYQYARVSFDVKPVLDLPDT
ncbi:MAG: hypothetical protein K2L99_01625, partial [Muribaculaceae bacterium]|nr:hypothetical protein [Muribaculaceae bacterium]